MTSETSQRGRVRSVVGLAALAVSGIAAPMAIGTAGANAATAPNVTRLSGADRTQTAIEVAKAAFGQGAKAPVAVLSRDDNYADALAGNALAAQKKGPLLLTPTAGLDPSVGTALKNYVQPGGVVYILGGTNALSANIESQVRALGFTPKRLQGASRFETATAIANEISPHPHTILVATANKFPDALSAGAAAAQDPQGGVVLLSDDNNLPSATQQYLNNVDPTKVNLYGVGIPGSNALKSVARFTGHVVEFRGLDRFETAHMVATNTTLFPNPTAVGIATGAQWADALSGGAYIAEQHGPLLLVDPDPGVNGLHPADKTWLAAQASKLNSVAIFGGINAVSDHIAQQIAQTVGSTTPISGPGAVTAPTASIVAKTGKGGAKAGIPIQFDASKSVAGSTPIKSYTFTFGDNSAPVTVNAPTASVLHTYTGGGLFQVDVTVTDVDGGQATAALRTFFVASSGGGGGVPGSFLPVGGLKVQVAVFDDHHHAGSPNKPAWCDPSTPQVGVNGLTSGPGQLLMYGAADSGGCGSGWDTPGIMVTNTTAATATVALNNVTLPAENQVSSTVGGVTTWTDAGNHGGSWSLWSSTITLAPGQSVIFAQTDALQLNNFDPGDSNNAGQIGADPAMCAAPSHAVPTFTLTINGAKFSAIPDHAQVLNTKGVDAAGCLAPSPGSQTRSNESLPWQAP